MKVQKPHRKGAKAAKVRKENFGFSLRSLRLCGEALLLNYRIIPEERT